jgi:geranylgeranyl transferase type-1 subunit beta
VYFGTNASGYQLSCLAGYTYNSIAALSFLKRLPESISEHNAPQSSPRKPNTGERGLENLQGTIWWLLSREVAYPVKEEVKYPTEERFSHTTVIPPQSQEASIADMPSLTTLSLQETQYVGFNGRINKLVDTCYCFWVSASLAVVSPVTRTKKPN